MLRPVRLSAPASTPVSLAEAKSHLRVEFDDDNELINSLVLAAVAHLEGWNGVLGRCLVTQIWRQDFGAWGNGCLRLPFPDVTSVTVKYFDRDNAEQTVPAEQFEILEDARGAFLRFIDAFAGPSLYEDRSDPVQVSFAAGYGDAAAVPQSIKQAMLLLIGHWYENREAVNIGNITSVLPMAVDALLAPHRRVGI
ncbi:phage head-tail connector protein [Stappia sp. F7233]|uniref:Phage head-tail connector protein n=1 Tax=Stappia albiluteola TaxID=2758565 RepID=A0A839AKU5_9HYPH|nr:head-tail connector protein [Stappia albiluteola]MBA5779492.1 phage head-tail connector protein [Stappia albiluteola]